MQKPHVLGEGLPRECWLPLFFSTSVGMYCPGKYAVIVSQEIDYLKPIRPDSHIEIIGKVIHKIESVHILIIEHTLVDGSHQTLVRGTSKVKVMK